MYRNSRRVSFKPFLPTCYQIPRARFIQQSNNDIGTTKNHWIRNQEILRLSIFYFISFNIMVGFKARASAYFTKLGWRCGCIFVDGVCVWGCVCVCVWRWGCVWRVCVCVWGGGYICIYGWGVLEGWESIEEGEKRNYTIKSYLLH